MTVEPEVITKDARIEPRAGQEPAQREGGHRYLEGSVNLARYRNDRDWGPQSARIQDVVRTVDIAVETLAECFVEAVAVGDAECGREIDGLAAQIDGLVKRLDLVEAANARLRRDNVELRDEVADLAHQVEVQRAARGFTDGHSLPPALVRRKAYPKPRPTQGTPGAETAA
jgi:hypothetical protein